MKTYKYYIAIIFAVVAGFTGYNPLLGVSNNEIAKFGLLFQMSIIPMIITIIGNVAFFFIVQGVKGRSERKQA